MLWNFKEIWETTEVWLAQWWKKGFKEGDTGVKVKAQHFLAMTMSSHLVCGHQVSHLWSNKRRMRHHHTDPELSACQTPITENTANFQKESKHCLKQQGQYMNMEAQNLVDVLGMRGRVCWTPTCCTWKSNSISPFPSPLPRKMKPWLYLWEHLPENSRTQHGS